MSSKRVDADSGVAFDGVVSFLEEAEETSGFEATNGSFLGVVVVVVISAAEVAVFDVCFSSLLVSSSSSSLSFSFSS